MKNSLFDGGEIITNSDEIRINKSIISDLLHSQWINYLGENLELIYALESTSIKVEKVSDKKIKYIIKLKPKEFNIIKDSLEYVLYYVVDNMPSLNSGYIQNGKNCNYIIFEQ